MKKLLLPLLLLILICGSQNSIQAQVSLNTNRPLIWGSSPFQDSLWSVDTTNWQVVNRIAPSIPGFTITGITGLAQDPTTGICYCIMKLSAVSGRVLGTINLSTGVCTQIGNLGDNFSTINFREDGQLFGVTGNGATVPETMYTIDKTTGVKTLATALGNGVDGEIICYNRVDDFFYHWSGNGTVVYEKVMSVAPYTVTNIPTSGVAGGETFGALYLTPTNFLRSTISSNYNRHNISGAYSSTFGSNPDDLRGLIMMPYWQLTSNDSVCQNIPVTFSVGGHQYYDTLYYNWGDGNIDSILVTNEQLSVGSHVYSSAGTFTVTIKTGNGFGGFELASQTVVVLPLPFVGIAGLGAICSGDSTTLMGSSGGTNQWYLNGSPIPGATTTTYTTAQPGAYNMVKTDVNGCSDSATGPIIVLIGSYPVVALGNDTSACVMYVLDAGNPGLDHIWSTGDTTQTLTVTASDIIEVMVTSAEGCATLDTINVTINALPTVNVGPDTTVCGSYMADAGNAGSSYLWCDGSTTQTVVLSTSGSCAVMVTDANGCSSSDTINVIINPNPVVALGPDVSGCTMVIITADSSLIGGTFLWCTGGTGLNEVITTSTTCDLQYTDVNGCTGADTINVTIFGNPTVTASSAPSSLCADDADAVLTGVPAGGSFTGTSVTGNNFDPSVGAGNYNIVYNYTDVNGCSGADTISIQVNACVGVNEVTADEFTLFPNPSTGVINLNLPEAGTTVEVVDVLGNVIVSKNFSNAGTTQLDLSAQSDGVYFVRVINGDSKNVKRVVIQK